jgi:hypothetical protein
MGLCSGLVGSAVSGSYPWRMSIGSMAVVLAIASMALNVQIERWAPSVIARSSSQLDR